MIKSDNKRLKVLEEKSAKSVHDVFLSSVKLINCSQEACCSLQYKKKRIILMFNMEV